MSNIEKHFWCDVTEDFEMNLTISISFDRNKNFNMQSKRALFAFLMIEGKH